ncbi:sec-independent protein translocase protein TatC [Methanolobus profundi]|uniref:Sec-independent protein translocase protein TatC n=2 Tax=Methanolobus profundi TaxID=487685 RepID=A0A1I4PR73_9EURY|nr:sec-independent protein translocase protein TatC [Methanolobus profundi]
MEDISVIIVSLKKKLALLLSLFFVVFMVSFQFAGLVISTIKDDLLPEGAKLVYVSPLEIMLLKMKIALFIGLFFIIPFILIFAVKALMKRNMVTIKVKKGPLFVVSVVALISFLAGVSYAYFIMLPLFIDYLYLNAAASGVVATYSIFSFISFAVQASLIFGLVFETPLVLTTLTRLDIVQYQTLVTYRKHIYVICLIIGAVITPPDIVSQMMVGIPLLIFFELSLIIVRIVGKGKKKDKT